MGGKIAGRGRPKEEQASCNHNGPNRGDVPYLLARLRRDRPDLAERVRAGELSAHAAVKEAGFRKDPTPLQRAQAAWRRMSDDERAEFEEWIATERRGEER